MNTVTALFGLLGMVGGLGSLSAAFYVGVTRRKIGAEARLLGVNADDIMSGRALGMYDRAMKEAGEAKAEARACREKVDALEDHIDRLERMMRDAGLTPPPFRWPPLQAAGSE